MINDTRSTRDMEKTEENTGGRISPPILHPITILATWFWTGLQRPAPGTWGSIGALPVAWLILSYGGPVFLIIAAILLAVLGVRISEAYIRLTNNSNDPADVVIDEVAGMWLTLAFAPVSVMGFVTALLWFRVFDIFKPWPIRRIDQKLSGGAGVVADDLVAGLYAGAIVYLLSWQGLLS